MRIKWLKDNKLKLQKVVTFILKSKLEKLEVVGKILQRKKYMDKKIRAFRTISEKDFQNTRMRQSWELK